ncbi:hypothetical protein K7432_003458 [Basidiobolus ranarum]|uniref:Uncharacterized protein n=1 Tax=Basidiobolus ranarum TaxID=34480 RepID=A0ABR2WZR8_9FUNG
MNFALHHLQYIKPAPIVTGNLAMTGLGSMSIAWFISTAFNRKRHDQPSKTIPTLSQDLQSYVWW